MENIINFFKQFTIENMINLLIAIGIVILFRITSSGFSYLVLKIFNKKLSKKQIKENPFYDPLKNFFIFFGIYIALEFWNICFGINVNILIAIRKIFQILTILIFANGLSKSLSTDSRFINKIRGKVNKNIDDTMLNFILKTVRVIIYIIAGFLIITELGYNLNGLIAGLGIGGVIVTLAAQDTAKNLFGGLVIFIDKPFIVGDWIQMAQFEGTVEDITFRSTRIRTFENSVVNIPNSILSNSSIINWSRMEKRRYKLNLELEADTPLEKVEKLRQRIEKMLEEHKRVIDDSIIVRFDSITENGINILVYSYTNSVDYNTFLEEKEMINYKIMQLLKEENINLAYPTRTVFLKN